MTFIDNPKGGEGDSPPPSPPPSDQPPGKPADESQRFAKPIPDKFMKDGKPDLEAFTKSYNELEGAVRKKSEDFKKEWEAERLKARPESADKYELPKPDGIDQ